MLFTANGDFFSAGNDLKDFAAQSAGAFEGPRHVGRFLETVINAEKPIVAAVQGHAVGVGTTMLFQCDLVFVAETRALTVPFVDLGLVPENASSLTVVDRLGHARAFALFGLGEPLLRPRRRRSGASPTPRCRRRKSNRAPAPPRRRWRRSRRKR